MKFLLDENAELRLARVLSDRGHEVTTIVRDFPTALPDDEVLAIAEREGRILITTAPDIERLVLQQGRPHAGVVFFRLPQGASRSSWNAWLRCLIPIPTSSTNFSKLPSTR